MAKTDPIDPNVPAGTEDPKLGDERIRALARAVAEILAVNHYMGTDGGAGVGYNEDAAGEHTQIKFNAPISTPTNAANKLFLYPKDVGGKVEFHILDEDGNEIQISSKGAILLTPARLPNDTYLKAIDAAGTGTVDLIKSDTNDVPVVPDGTQTATNAAPDEDKDLANKKYIDDSIASEVAMSAYTSLDSESQTMLKSHAYKAVTAGFVSARVALTSAGDILHLYVGTDSDPTDEHHVDAKEAGKTNQTMTVQGWVAKDEYFEVRSDSGTPSILWKSLGTLSKPVDQD